MKRITVMMLAALLTLSLMACGSETPAATEAPAVTEAADETTAAQEIEAETEVTEATETSAAQSGVDLAALYASCTEKMTPMMMVEKDMRLDFMGIHDEDCRQVYTAFAEDGLLTDELWLIEAKDGEALERLQKLAEARMQAKADETVSYSPEQYAVVEKGVILTENLYLALIVSPNVEEIKAEVLAAVK